jgi:hypothetical protein
MLGKLGILAGGGALSEAVIKHCQSVGRSFHVIGFTHQPQIDKGLKKSLKKSGHYTQHGLLQIGHIVATLKAEGVQAVTLVGNLNKPGILGLIPDAEGAKLLAKVLIKHDDALLRTAMTYLTEHGFNIEAPHKLLPDLLTPEGVLGTNKPSKNQLADIELGVKTLKATGAMDIGQAVIVKDGTVLGLEAAEGTDELIKRCAKMRGHSMKGAVLVKMPKPGQSEDADLPVIGRRTIKNLKAGQYAGVAVAAGGSILVERDELLKTAKDLFVYGVPENEWR